jgi:CRP-like cAMP-binding protein
MSATQEITESIRTRLNAIEHEIASLNAALARLDAQAAGSAPRGDGHGASAATPARRSRAGRRRGTPELAADALAQLVNAGHGVSAADLAKQLNTDRSQVLARLKELEAQGTVRRTGERRATRWHAVSDEDRIRERAAELERRPKARPRAGA